MPPRLQNLLLRVCPARSIALIPACNLLPDIQSLSLCPTASQTSSFHKSSVNMEQKKRKRDRYALEKAKELKEKHVARQAQLKAERDAAACDPVTGRDTKFTGMLDAKPKTLPSVDDVAGEKTIDNPADPDQHRFNHFLTKDAVAQFLDNAKMLAFPPGPMDYVSPEPEKVRQIGIKDFHAVEAVRRIVSLGNGSNKDKLRDNKQRCILRFGRHNTDITLPPDPTKKAPDLRLPQKTPRAGPDTGSSEVQAAILTTKIRALAEHVKNNKKDVTNKRNLRLLVHKRQKILRYLKRKEKGGVRYRNVMEQLGLDDRAIEQELFL